MKRSGGRSTSGGTVPVPYDTRIPSVYNQVPYVVPYVCFVKLTDNLIDNVNVNIRPPAAGGVKLTPSDNLTRDNVNVNIGDFVLGRAR